MYCNTKQKDLFILVIWTSPKKSDASVVQEVDLINSNTQEPDVKNKLPNEACADICEEVLVLKREESECIADSEESGLEYESATDGDTLVHSDDSDDEDILDAPLLKMITQVCTPGYGYH